MLCAAMIVRAVSRKVKPRVNEKTIVTRSTSARIDNRIFSRKTAPTTNPSANSAIAANPIPVYPSFLTVDVGMMEGKTSCTDRQSLLVRDKD